MRLPLVALALVASSCDGSDGRRSRREERERDVPARPSLVEGRPAGDAGAPASGRPDGGRERLAEPRVTACTADPEGGAVVARGRGRPSIGLGRSGALVIHRTRSPHNWELGRPSCEWMDAAVALRLPIGSSEPAIAKPLEHGADCAGHYPDPIRVLRFDGEAVGVDCDYLGTESWSCGFIAPFASGPSSIQIGFPREWSAASISSAFTSSGHSILGAAVTSTGRLVGFVATAGDPVAMGQLGSVAPSVFSRSIEVRTEASAGGGAEVTWMGDQGQAYRVSMDASARATGPVVRIDRPPPAGAPFWLLEKRRSRQAPPHLVAGRSKDALAPVAGIDPDPPTSQPALVRAGARFLLAWTEGQADEARVPVGTLDPETLSVSAIGPVSSSGSPAGSAAIDSHEGRSAIAWEEKTGDDWVVRVASLRCP
ncbi:MAG: hypothetical protein HYY06_32580 [Deltaproteobacteria bacterium]|nr:hypothetical protein [Deltaproteobacteria bacterium]